MLFNAPACTQTKTSRGCLLHSCQHSHGAWKGTKDPNCPSGGRTLLEGGRGEGHLGTRMDSVRQVTYLGLDCG